MRNELPEALHDWFKLERNTTPEAIAEIRQMLKPFSPCH